MPLKNVSGDDSHDYFAEILTGALITEFARVRELKVISSMAPELAASAIVVGGSVMRTGNHVQIKVAIIDPKTECQLWSQSYNRDLGEILTVQKEVACGIAAQVRADCMPQDQMQVATAPLIKPEAYDCYLRGRFYVQRQNKEDNQTATLALERAVAIDPTFASAYAKLAQAYIWKLFLFDPHDRQWEEKAFVAVEKALSLQPDLAVAYLARGRLLWTPANHFPHMKAVREYRRALTLNPSLDEARNQLALIYCHIGYFEQALRESYEAMVGNPHNNLAAYRTAETFAFQGKYQQAFSVLRTIPQNVNPSLIGYQTAWILFNLGRQQEASEKLDQLLIDYPEDDGALFVSMQAVLAAAAGDASNAEAKIKVAIETGKGFGHFHHSAYQIAIAFAFMNHPEHAVKWLDAATTDGFPCYPLFERDVNLDNLRQDPHFIEFMTVLKHQWLGYQEIF